MSTHDSAPQSSDVCSSSGEATRDCSAEATALPRDAAELAGRLTLSDGVALYQRAIRADDATHLQAFHKRLSHQSILFRFFGEVPELSVAFAERLSHVDYDTRMAVVVNVGAGADEPIIAVARYQRLDQESAEIGLAVEDDWQGRGLGPRLMRTLAAYGRGRGILTFIAYVMIDNSHMLAMLRHSGFPTTFSFREGRVVARLDISGAGMLYPESGERPHA
ncbi:MAG TPA: GNAT family N-acetyltransferase [Ktedonobacterales bacterium]